MRVCVCTGSTEVVSTSPACVCVSTGSTEVVSTSPACMCVCTGSTEVVSTSPACMCVCTGSTEVVSTSPACMCGAHLACCRTRIGMMNDAARNDAYIAALSPVSLLFPLPCTGTAPGSLDTAYGIKVFQWIGWFPLVFIRRMK